MIGQTCQRCGHEFGRELSPAYARNEEGAGIYIGEWSRSWVLCDRCAEDLQRHLVDFFEGVTARVGLLAKDGSDKRPAEPNEDWLYAVWTPVEEELPAFLTDVLLKLQDGTVLVGYHGNDCWKRRRRDGPVPIYPTCSVVAWAYLPGSDDE